MIIGIKKIDFKPSNCLGSPFKAPTTNLHKYPAKKPAIIPPINPDPVVLAIVPPTKPAIIPGLSPIDCAINAAKIGTINPIDVPPTVLIVAAITLY